MLNTYVYCRAVLTVRLGFASCRYTDFRRMPGEQNAVIKATALHLGHGEASQANDRLKHVWVQRDAQSQWDKLMLWQCVGDKFLCRAQARSDLWTVFSTWAEALMASLITPKCSTTSSDGDLALFLLFRSWWLFEPLLLNKTVSKLVQIALIFRITQIKKPAHWSIHVPAFLNAGSPFSDITSSFPLLIEARSLL